MIWLRPVCRPLCVHTREYYYTAKEQVFVKAVGAYICSAPRLRPPFQFSRVDGPWKSIYTNRFEGFPIYSCPPNIFGHFISEKSIGVLYTYIKTGRDTPVWNPMMRHIRNIFRVLPPPPPCRFLSTLYTLAWDSVAGTKLKKKMVQVQKEERNVSKRRWEREREQKRKEKNVTSNGAI